MTPTSLQFIRTVSFCSVIRFLCSIRLQTLFPSHFVLFRSAFFFALLLFLSLSHLYLSYICIVSNPFSIKATNSHKSKAARAGEKCKWLDRSHIELVNSGERKNGDTWTQLTTKFRGTFKLLDRPFLSYQ